MVCMHIFIETNLNGLHAYIYRDEFSYIFVTCTLCLAKKNTVLFVNFNNIFCPSVK